MCQTPELNIGFGRRDITPDHSVPMQGYGNNHLRMSQGVLTPLLATCVAISDEHDETLLVFTVDVCDTRTELMDEIRAAITAATGVDGDRIMLSATHTHAGPDILSFCCDNMARWKQTWLTGVSGAAADAMADHTREYVPLLVLGKKVQPVDLGTRESFADLAATVAELLGVEFATPGKSFAERLLKG